MQPAPDKVNRDDAESLFDFLDGGEDRSGGQSVENTDHDSQSGRRRRMTTSGDENANKPFPVIRKPVRVSETGPLRAPRPGDPVEPPPALTDGLRSADATESNRRPVQRAEPDLDELDLDLGLDDDEWPSSESWADKSHRPVPVNYQPRGSSFARKAGYFLGIALVVCGAAYALIGVPVVKQWTESAVASVAGAIDEFSSDARQDDAPINVPTSDSTVPMVAGTGDSINAIDATPTTSGPKTLNELFKEQLAQLELLVQSGSLDAAEQALSDMDRSVYGYGAPEFTEIEGRIATLRQGGVVQAEPSAGSQNALAEDLAIEQQRIQEEARQEELARAELRAADAATQAEEAAQAEATQAEATQAELARAEAVQAELAQAEAAQAEVAQQQRAAELAAEQERLAAETARAEQERLAQEAEITRARQVELDRAAAQAEQIRADRVAQERARQEQLALALQERAQLERQSTSEQAATSNTPGDWQNVAPNATDQSVQQLAASQREAARQQRLVEARQREEQTAGSLPPVIIIDSPSQDTVPSVPETVVVLADPEPVAIAPSTQPAPISDADLQQVYGQFAQLQNAIESRDINTVIALTQRSGARIQQAMQLFANNVAITARLRNVSTLDSAGEIQGTLQITRLERADGAVTGPPQNFSSVRLSSVRDGDGWSAISW